MKKLDRYVIRELIVPFLAGTVAVALMFQANQLIFLLKSFPVQHVPIPALLQLILYKTPYWLNMTLPTGMSLAASLAIARLARESEITAMRAAGARVLRVIRPVVVFGLAVAVGNYLMVEKVMPRSERSFNKLFAEFSNLVTSPTFQSNAFVRLKNYDVSVGTVFRDKNDVLRLTDVLLIERPRPFEIALTTAAEGEYRNGIWKLRKTYVRRFEHEDLVQAFTSKDVVINEPISIADLFSAATTTEELTAEQLKQSIEQGKRVGANMTVQEIAYHVRFSVPAACLVFALVAPILAVWFARTGGFVGVLLSIFIVFLYYNAYVVSTEILGKNGWVSPVVSAWLPNMLFIFLGLLGVRRLE